MRVYSECRHTSVLLYSLVIVFFCNQCNHNINKYNNTIPFSNEPGPIYNLISIGPSILMAPIEMLRGF